MQAIVHYHVQKNPPWTRACVKCITVHIRNPSFLCFVLCNNVTTENQSKQVIIKLKYHNHRKMFRFDTFSHLQAVATKYINRNNVSVTFICGPGSSVGIATDYGLDSPGSNPGGDEIFRRPVRPWGSPSLL